MTKDDRVRFTFRLPNKLFDEINSKATEKGVSLNALLLEILWKWAEGDKNGGGA